MNHDYVEIAKAYLAALERGDTETALACYAEDVVQQEFPNRLVPGGATRDLTAVREGAAPARKSWPASSINCCPRSPRETAWRSRCSGLARSPSPWGPSKGGHLHHRFAIFLEFRDDKIVRQHNYDCFEPW